MHPMVCMYVSVYLSICLFINPSIYLIYLFICLFIYFFIFLSFFFCLSVYLPFHLCQSTHPDYEVTRSVSLLVEALLSMLLGDGALTGDRCYYRCCNNCCQRWRAVQEVKVLLQCCSACPETSAASRAAAVVFYLILSDRQTDSGVLYQYTCFSFLLFT